VRLAGVSRGGSLRPGLQLDEARQRQRRSDVVLEDVVAGQERLAVPAAVCVQRDLLARCQVERNDDTLSVEVGDVRLRDGRGTADVVIVVADAARIFFVSARVVADGGPFMDGRRARTRVDSPTPRRLCRLRTSAAPLHPSSCA